MGGRGTFAAGIDTPYNYQTVGKIEGIKILEGLGNQHGLPESSHSSMAYIKLKPDGTFHEMRLYNEKHELYMEIGYHPEPSLTNGDREHPMLHYHLYDERFSKNGTGPFYRSEAKFLTKEMILKYKKYFKGVKGV